MPLSHPIHDPAVIDQFSAEVDELVRTGAEFHRRGWSLGTSSNYSVVVEREPLTLLLTGSGFDKGRLKPGQFVLVDAQGASLHASYPKPSAETMLHVVLARAAGAGAVLHTHSVAGTVLSEGFLGRGALPISGYEMLKGLHGITTHESSIDLTIFPNTQDIDTLAVEVERRLKDAESPLRHGFLMAGHGLYTWGKDLAEARRQVEVLEFLFEVVTQKRLLFPAQS
jgi:methylthioribulose-1-phosphate dehydratase